VRYILLCTLLLLGACHHINSVLHPVSKLHYSGIYQAKSSDSDGIETFNHLRFYSDGKVISLRSASDAKVVRYWFNLEDSNVIQDEYTRVGNEINFTLNSSGKTGNRGNFMHEGQVLYEKVKLKRNKPYENGLRELEFYLIKDDIN